MRKTPLPLYQQAKLLRRTPSYCLIFPCYVCCRIFSSLFPLSYSFGPSFLQLLQPSWAVVLIVCFIFCVL